MASGGTIPNNRTQTVTFFNTTGIIEKEKGIYLSPRFKSRGEFLNEEVREAYLEVLDEQAVRDPDYTDIVISSWSPQDRVLTVRGNIDDFRLVTDEGDCLNYLIVTRNVTKGNVTNTYYYGFFITEVAQAGGSSIRVTVEPDDFTNIFYLHNKHVLTSTDINATEYDPFNERMKNCYVQRQHYNRVGKSAGYYLLDIRIMLYTGMSQGTLVKGQPIELRFEDSDLTVVEGVLDDFDDREVESSHVLYLTVKTDDEYQIGVGENYSTLVYDNLNYTFDYDTQDIEWTYEAPLYPVNQRIFLNQEESYKFKYQYKDKKFPLSMGETFSDAEIQTIKERDSLNLLSDTLKKKIILASIQYLVVELKSTEKIIKEISVFEGPASSLTPTEGSPFSRDFVNYIQGFRKENSCIFEPFLNIPKEFIKYETDIMQYACYGKFKNSADTAIINLSGEGLYAMVNSNAFGDFAYSAYVVNDLNIPKTEIDIDLTNKRIYFMLDNTRDNDISSKGLYFVAIDNNNVGPSGSDLYNVKCYYQYFNHVDYQNNRILKVGTDVPNHYSLRVSFSLMMNGYDKRDIDISFYDNIANLKNNYYDFVLEAEPYSFYSIAYLNYEMPFNKNRYYEDMKINIECYYSVNGAVKIGLIPLYKVEGKEYRYLNESLTFTLPSNLPIISDSYSSYYYQNQAQMKNQYAVNEYNKGVDLAQHFFISGPNAVGQRAFRMGGVGANAETINQISQMLNESIDLAQSSKEIQMNQRARLADMGAKPDVIKQTGTDAFYDLVNSENRPYLNHYTIDSLSYNSIAKLFERIGYQVNLYTTLNVNDRVGWNYIKLISFDWNPAFDIMVGQEENLRKIFADGVTLLHSKNFLTSGHNYETILDE